MLIGYARVSKTDQNLDRQIDALVSAGVDPRMIYMEKMTGTRIPGLIRHRTIHITISCLQS